MCSPIPDDARHRTPLKVPCLLMAGVGVILLGVAAVLFAGALNAGEGESIDWPIPGIVAFFGFDLLVMAGVIWKLGQHGSPAGPMR